MNQNKFKKSLEDMYKIAKTGISKEDKDLILSELDDMEEMLKRWKANNSEVIQQKKAS